MRWPDSPFGPAQIENPAQLGEHHLFLSLPLCSIATDHAIGLCNIATDQTMSWTYVSLFYNTSTRMMFEYVNLYFVYI